MRAAPRSRCPGRRRLAPPGRVERKRAPGVARLDRLEHVLDGDVEALGELGRGRQPPQLLGQLCRRRVDAHRQLLQAAGQTHGPDVIAEVPAQLAEDRRHRVRRKGLSSLRVEPVDRLDQSQPGDLDQVVERLGLAPVAHGERARQRHEPRDHLLAQLRRRLGGIPAQQSQIRLDTRFACAAARRRRHSTSWMVRPRSDEPSPQLGSRSRRCDRPELFASGRPVQGGPLGAR